MKHLKWLMFDADNTLLDFDKASKDALWGAFKEYNFACTETIYLQYKQVNSKIWQEFEAGTLSAVELRTRRFANLFDKIGHAPTSAADFSRSYLSHLVSESESYVGVATMLSKLSEQYNISLITNGLKEVQRPRLDKLNLTQYFDSIIVSDEIGVAKPEASFFEAAFSSISHKFDKHEVLVVGDNLIADIGGANDFGFQSCWIQHDKVNSKDITPDYQITNIGEFSSLLQHAH